MSKLISKTILSTSSALFLVLAFAVVPIQAQAAVITVTTTANDGAGSLRDAIDFAKDNAGTTIIFDGTVFPGTIFLETRLPKIDGQPNTTIDGTGKGVTISGANLNQSNGHGLRVRASGTTIRGLTLLDFPGDGIRIQPKGSSINKTLTNVLIENNTFNTKRDVVLGIGSDAILVRGGRNKNTVGVTISGNTIMRTTDDGIVVRGSFCQPGAGGNNVTVTIDGNILNHSEGGKVEGLSGDGIRVASGCDESSISNMVMATIINNTISNSEDQGIIVLGTSGGDIVSSNNQMHAVISGNTVRTSGRGALQDPPLPTSSGIAVTGGGRLGVTGGSGNVVTFIISNNIVSDSTNHGISVSGGGGSAGNSHDVSGTISGNTVTSNGGRGIQISGGQADNTEVRVTVSNNVVRTSGKEGIFIRGGTGDNNIVENINVLGNTSIRNGREGIQAFRGFGSGNIVSLTGISNNIVKANGGDGILIGGTVPGAGMTPVSGNTASGNSIDGIRLTSTGYRLFNNRADRNGGDGINAVGNTDGGGNTAKGNADCNSPTFCF